MASSQACDGHRESWRRLVGASLGLNAATSCRRCDVFRRWEGRARMPTRCSPTRHQISSGATSQPIRRSHWWRRAVRPAPVRDQVTRSLLADGGASAVDARATTRWAAEAAPADAGRRRHQCSSTFLILAKHISIPFTSVGTVVHGLVSDLFVSDCACVCLILCGHTGAGRDWERSRAPIALWSATPSLTDNNNAVRPARTACTICLLWLPCSLQTGSLAQYGGVQGDAG